ncbi:helix-turn-helix domain-containing protein [Nocardioides sp. NPDC127503]|uniref:helix-turn-helix domain-containing protein n=1 Tax=Nocardioides sp. NPDC127503 TaxID=3154516 RepID=UPI00332F9A25
MFTISTRDVPVREQQDFWRTTIVNNFFAVDSTMPAPPQAGYDSRMTRIEFGGLTIDSVHADPARVSRSARLARLSPSETMQISVLLRGRSALSQEGRTAVLTEPGDFAFIDTSRPYVCEFFTPGDQIMVQVPPTVLAPGVGIPDDLTAVTVRGQAGLSAVASSALLALDRLGSDRNDALASSTARSAVELAANALLECLPGDPTRAPAARILEQAQRFIEAHLHDADLRPADVAAAIPVSERYLYAVFQESGSTPSRWLREARLDRARRLLDGTRGDGARSIEAVGAAVGLPRASHFSRLFRERYAISPRGYRDAFHPVQPGEHEGPLSPAR